MAEILIRADSGMVLGSGHVTRCLTLAAALRERGESVRFVSRRRSGDLVDEIAARGFEVTRLPAHNIPDSGVDASTNWLGAAWEADGAETARAIEELGSRPSWLIV